MAANPAALAALKRYWGFSAFRHAQAQVIDAILEGRDALCIMATGAGKSLCYQIPPLVSGKVCLVVSPLISLMQDQARGLATRAAAAAR